MGVFLMPAGPSIARRLCFDLDVCRPSNVFECVVLFLQADRAYAAALPKLPPTAGEQVLHTRALVTHRGCGVQWWQQGDPCFSFGVLVC